MKSPDCFERMVGKYQTIWLSGHVSKSINAKDAVKLLRRQHAQFVRLVKRQEPLIHKSIAYPEWVDRRAILRALAQWRRGAKCR